MIDKRQGINTLSLLIYLLPIHSILKKALKYLASMETYQAFLRIYLDFAI